MTAKEFCIGAKKRLSECNGGDYANLFIRLYLDFFRTYGHGFITSTVHGLDYFDNILYCLGGQKWAEQGEYGDNFRKMIELNKQK